MPRKKKKRVVKLQNKTNTGLFELDNNNKIQDVHLITPAYEAEIYKKIGYKSRHGKLSKTDEDQGRLRPVTAEDIEDEDSQPFIISSAINNVNDRKPRRQVKDILSSSGIL